MHKGASAGSEGGGGKSLPTDTTQTEHTDAPNNTTSSNDTSTPFNGPLFIKTYYTDRCWNQPINFDEGELYELIEMAEQSLLAEPTLLRLSPPVNVVGSLHGDLKALLYWLEIGGWPPSANYLCLGNYVDRGERSLEVLVLLLVYKTLFPTNFFLLRGSHEIEGINKHYGFQAQILQRYSVNLWKAFQPLFDSLPLAATVGGRIFCVHSGLSPELRCLDQINSIKRPVTIPQKGLGCDLLWADPMPSSVGKRKWTENPRGISSRFGPAALDKFCKDTDIELVVRSHQVVQDGFQFFGRCRLVTIFSTACYCEELANSAAMLHVSANMKARFLVLEGKTPEEDSLLKTDLAENTSVTTVSVKTTPKSDCSPTETWARMK